MSRLLPDAQSLPFACGDTGGEPFEGPEAAQWIYTQDFNRRHKKVGHVFQGRYGAILVEKENYFLVVARYVVLNPVKAGLVKHPRQWRWSSYRATAGEVKPPDFLKARDLLDRVDHRSIGKAQEGYQRFVKEGMGQKDDGLPMDWNKMPALGRQEFLEKVRSKVRSRGLEKEYSKEARFVGRPSMKKLFGTERTQKQRNQAIRRAYRACGYSRKEIAEYLDSHYTTVSLVIRGRRSAKNPVWGGQN